MSIDLYRPLEADNYKADYSKAENQLRWSPKTTFKELVQLMVKSDLNCR